MKKRLDRWGRETTYVGCRITVQLREDAKRALDQAGKTITEAIVDALAKWAKRKVGQL